LSQERITFELYRHKGRGKGVLGRGEIGQLLHRGKGQLPFPRESGREVPWRTGELSGLALRRLGQFSGPKKAN